MREVGESEGGVARVLDGFPVYSVLLYIANVLLYKANPSLQSAWAILKEAEEVSISRSGVALTFDIHGVVVPRMHKVLRILTDRWEEEMM